MKKRLFVLLVLAAAMGLGARFYLCGRACAPGGGGLVLYGNVDIRDVSLGFRAGGRIAALFFEEGDRVAKGAVMAELESDLLNDEYALAKARVDEAMARSALAEKGFVRTQCLTQTGAVSEQDYDEALAARDEAAAAVATAKAQLNIASTRLADARFSSPADGTVTVRVREPGAIVSEGAAVYTLSLDRPVWVRAYVAEPELGLVYPGQEAVVMTDSGGSYAGRVGFISPQAEFTPKNVETSQLRTDLVYRLRVIVDKPDNGLRQGMPVTVRFDRKGRQEK